MSKRPNLSRDEIRRAFESDSGKWPPIMSPKVLAQLLGRGPKTIYFWIAQGRLDGAFRKRGKHCLIWRDRVIDILFNGKDWTEHD